MTIPFSGGCACGKIRYTCTAAPIAMLNCHCQDCQISSGAPFASGIIVALASTQVEGAPNTYTLHSAAKFDLIRIISVSLPIGLFIFFDSQEF